MGSRRDGFLQIVGCPRNFGGLRLVNRTIELLFLSNSIQLVPNRQRLGPLGLILLASDGVIQDVDFEFGHLGFFDGWRHGVALAFVGENLPGLVVATANVIKISRSYRLFGAEIRFMTDGILHTLINEFRPDNRGFEVAV